MLNDNLLDALLKTRMNHYLSEKEIDVLLKHADLEVFSDGEYIIKQGKKSKGIYIIIEGSVIVCSKLLGEGDICLAKLHCGNYFGEISVIAKQACVSSFIADGNVKCIFIKEIYFNNLSLFFPKIKYKISQAICDDINSRYHSLYDAILKILEQRKINYNMILSKAIPLGSAATQIKIEDTQCKLSDIIKADIFETLTEKELEIFLQYWICLDAPKNCILIREGERSAGCFIILQGAVQVNIIHQHHLAKIAVLGPLKLFSPLSIIDPLSPSLINFTACERAILLHISHQHILHLQEKHITIWYKFFDLICAAFASLERATNELDLRLRSEVYKRL